MGTFYRLPPDACCLGTVTSALAEHNYVGQERDRAETAQRYKAAPTKAAVPICRLTRYRFTAHQ